MLGAQTEGGSFSAQVLGEERVTRYFSSEPNFQTSCLSFVLGRMRILLCWFRGLRACRWTENIRVTASLSSFLGWAIFITSFHSSLLFIFSFFDSYSPHFLNGTDYPTLHIVLLSEFLFKVFSFTFLNFCNWLFLASRYFRRADILTDVNWRWRWWKCWWWWWWWKWSVKNDPLTCLSLPLAKSYAPFHHDVFTPLSNSGKLLVSSLLKCSVYVCVPECVCVWAGERENVAGVFVDADFSLEKGGMRVGIHFWNIAKLRVT